MSFQDHFSKQAKVYSRHRPRYPSTLFDYLASLASGRSFAWDCGTGSGQAAVELAERFDHVVATDPSTEQINNAYPNQKVEYRVEPAEHTSIDSHSVDLITVGTAIHWFDFDSFYEEVRRVARPSGILAAWTYHLPVIAPVIDRWLETFFRETLDGYWPERIKYLDACYRTIPFPFQEIMPPAFEARADWNLDDLLGFLGSWSAIRRFADTEGANPIDQNVDRFRRAWGKSADRLPVRWPLHFRIGRVVATDVPA